MQKRALAEKVKGELQNSEKHVSIHLAQEINADTVLTQVCSPYSKKLVSGKLRNTVKNILRKVESMQNSCNVLFKQKMSENVQTELLVQEYCCNGFK